MLDTNQNNKQLFWKEIKTINPPEPRAGMSLNSINNNLYLFGGSGTAAKCYNDLIIFDFLTQVWHKCEIQNQNQIKPRAGHSMTSVKDQIYIIGGSYGQQYFKDFYLLDVEPAPLISYNPNSSVN